MKALCFYNKWYPDMKRTPAMKNSEKICKLKYWESTSHQEPD